MVGTNGVGDLKGGHGEKDYVQRRIVKRELTVEKNIDPFHVYRHGCLEIVIAWNAC